MIRTTFYIIACIAIIMLFVSIGLSHGKTISWDAPIDNTDGSALTDLAGYWIYYNDKVVLVDDPYQTSVDIEDMTDITTYKMTAYDYTGNESLMSVPWTEIKGNVKITGNLVIGE